MQRITSRWCLDTSGSSASSFRAGVSFAGPRIWPSKGRHVGLSAFLAPSAFPDRAKSATILHQCETAGRRPSLTVRRNDNDSIGRPRVVPAWRASEPGEQTMLRIFRLRLLRRAGLFSLAALQRLLLL